MFRFFTILLMWILCGAELDLFIPSFPELQKVFQLTPFMVQLTLSVNFVAFCLFCIFAGTLGDRFNRRHVILISLGIFIVGSILCVSANSFTMLLVGRFLQGIGIAAPTTLSFAVIADEYLPEERPRLMGILNGIASFTGAFAPVVGSMVNLYFNWRANFTILLILGMLCFVCSYFAVHGKKGDPHVSLSPISYLPLLRSSQLMTHLSAIWMLTVPYWVFVGMAPILYMEGLGVPLKYYGYYQGAMSLVFATVSIMSFKLLDEFGQKKCFYFGKWTSFCGAGLVLIIMLLNVKDPMIIAGVMIVLAVGAVFPINILYPLSLEVLENTRGRAAALNQALRLVITAIMLELVSYFYSGSFLSIGVVLFSCMLIFFIIIKIMIYKQWLTFQD